MQHATHNAVREDIRSQGRYAVGLMILGVGFLIIFATIGRERLSGWMALMPVAIGVGLMAYARHEFGQYRRRTHGLRQERRAIDDALQVMPRFGFAVTPNFRARALGDIDLVVGNGTAHIPVEIKAFRDWDASSKRGQETLAQAERMRRFLRARRGYVWLPDAPASWWLRTFGMREGATTIVFGKAKNLARIIRRQGG